jgi:LacI family transcriptional regulator, repressor for deo operon, udp, cdd, tsx, nupC, and nupG
VRHILELGHTEIAYVGTVPSASAQLETPQDRRSAFDEALAESGLSCPPEWVIESDWTAAGAARDSVPLMEGPRCPTAVVAASDEMAFGVMSAARRLGLDVPSELSVIGIDDHAMSGVLDLTTVRQDVELQGRLAGKTLMDWLLGGETPAHVDEIVPVELVVRASTAPPPSCTDRRGWSSG